MPSQTGPNHSAQNQAARPRRGHAALMLVGFILLVLLRLPRVVLQGRFYAEEATNFFAYAWHMPWREALFHPLGGYLNIVASGSTLLAARLVQYGWLSLEGAPYVTILIALFFQVCPALLIVQSRDSWLSPPWAKPLALLLLATVPATEEVWLHSLHSQFHLSVCVALIMVLNVPEGRAGRNGSLALLALAPLCGPASIVLLPVLAVKAAVDRTRGRAIQALVLTGASALQLLVFYAPVSVRSFRLDPMELAANFAVRQVALPFATPAAGYALGDVLQPPMAPGLSLLISAAVIASVFLPLGLAALRRWRAAPIWLLVSAGMIAGASYLGALSKPFALLMPYAGERYTFVPQALVDLAIIGLVTTAGGRTARFGRILLILLVLVAAVTWPFKDRSIERGPDWRDEVAAWRKDPAYQPMAWPARWTTDLSSVSPRCDSMPADQAPLWCDEAWLERQKVETVEGGKQGKARGVFSGPDLGKAEALCRPDETGPALLVKVAGLKDKTGNIKLEVYPANDDGFLDDDAALVAERKVFRRVEQPVGTEAQPVVCVRLPGPGTYSLIVLHDRNANHKLNFTNEGIGFASNPKIGWGLPKAAEASVVVPRGGLSATTVVLNYRTGLVTFEPLARR